MITVMFYSPLYDLYLRYKTRVHDFLFQFVVMLIVYLVDSYSIYNLQLDRSTISLGIFLILYGIGRQIIRFVGKQELFGNFANESFTYCSLLASGAWLGYFLFIRLPRFH